MLQRGPGRSAREIVVAEGGSDADVAASKRPRPFSPGNSAMSDVNIQKEPASKRPRPFSPGNSAVPAWNLLTAKRWLQRGPGRLAREISPSEMDTMYRPAGFKEAQAV